MPCWGFSLTASIVRARFVEKEDGTCCCRPESTSEHSMLVFLIAAVVIGDGFQVFFRLAECRSIQFPKVVEQLFSVVQADTSERRWPKIFVKSV